MPTTSLPIFCATVPKSGTHLMANVLRQLFGPENVATNMFGEAELAGLQKFERVAYIGHFDHSLGLGQKLVDHPFILLGRDPRDVVASYCSAIFGGKLPPDAFTTYVQTHKLTPSAVLATLITGTHDDGLNVAGIQDKFLRYYLKWLPYASAVVRFEDLLPCDGDWSKPVEVARQVLALVNLEKTDAEIMLSLKEASDPTKSRTFHRGQPGRWAELFTPAHVALFEATAPGLLRTLGYAGFTCSSPELASTPNITAAPVSAPQAAVSAAYEGVLPALLASFDSLSGRFSRLKSVNDQVHMRISFLTDNDSGLGYFCWTDDYKHRSMGQTFSDHRQFDAYVESMDQPTSMADRLAKSVPPMFSPVARAIEPMLADGRKIRFIDVGCFYGMEVCVVAKLLAKYPESFRATAFDPGWAGRLAPYTIEINRLAGVVDFEPVAITWHDGTAMVYGEYGQCENFRTVNRMVDNENCSYPTKAVTLDTYVKEKSITEELFLKIDIQGGEYQALKGAQRVLQEQSVGLMLKFIPHALSSMIRPEEFLALLPARPYRLYAVSFYQTLSDANAIQLELKPEDFPRYATDLQKAKEDYSYLLILFETRWAK